MTGRYQSGLRLAGDMVLVEADALVAREDRVATSDQAVPVPQNRRHPRNFETSLLARSHDPARLGESGVKEGTDVVWLKAACRCSFHFLTDALHRSWGRALLE